MLTASGKICVALILVAILAGGIWCLSGCTRVMEIDRLLWSPPTATDEETAAGHPPPLIELLAGGLALLGFGGMAAWIRRIKHRSCTKAEVETIVKNNNTKP